MKTLTEALVPAWRPVRLSAQWEKSLRMWLDEQYQDEVWQALVTSMIAVATHCPQGPNASGLSLGWELFTLTANQAGEHVFGCGHSCYHGCESCRARISANERAFTERRIREVCHNASLIQQRGHYPHQNW
jgi:hypothetical protein